VTRKTDPNLCPNCQRKRLKEQFSRAVYEGRKELSSAREALNNGTNLWQDDETKARIQKGNITWDLSTARGTTDFKRDERRRQHSEPVRYLTPKEMETAAKAGRTRAQTSRGHGYQQPYQVDIVAASSQGLSWPLPSSPPSVPLPLAPPATFRGGRASSTAHNPPRLSPPLVPWQAEGRPVSKALPPLPLTVKRKPVPSNAPLSRHAERANYSGTHGTASSHSFGRNEHPSRHRLDNDQTGRSRQLEPLKPPSRDGATKETARGHRSKPSSSRSRHDQSQSRSGHSREPQKQEKSSRLNQPPKLGRTPVGSRFVEHFSSDEDIRRVRLTPAATTASTGGPSGGRRRGPPTSFDDERLRGPLPNFSTNYNESDEEMYMYRVKNAWRPPRESKDSGKKSTKSWLKNLRPGSPVETDLSFTCQSARNIEARR
jgi:hypothetical protein